ncbi:MAG: T9SS type A sorting domain-containing protein [Bacteroidota bacterium]
MKYPIFNFAFLLLAKFASGQSYTAYFTGNTTDVSPTPLGGTCMMGGATEDDNAMRWFLERANGGDVLVLRASGSDGYNDYFFDELGVAINSVETIVFHDAAAASDTYVLQQIANAEAIWLAGGDQWDYVSYWRNTQVSEIINQNIEDKNMVIGGTSAGMAILGGIYFSAENGTIQSSAALANPYNNSLTISQEPFLKIPFLENVITDTHYDNPDRKGRQTVFLARAMKDWGVSAKGIACDEYTSVCIDNEGIAYVYGAYPNYDDNAYFLQVNCLPPNEPEICEPTLPLTWNRDNAAIKVFQIKGESSGSGSFDLNTWEVGTGGTWQNWYVENGNLTTVNGAAINCDVVSTGDFLERSVSVFPNPIENGIFKITSENLKIQKVEIFNSLGHLIFKEKQKQYTYIFDLADQAKGIYWVKIYSQDSFITKKIIQ